MTVSWPARLVMMLVGSHLFVSSTLAQTEANIEPTQTVMESLSSVSPSKSSRPTNHFVRVGSDGYRYTPSSLTNVSVGDVVTFEFYPLDHSVARAQFKSACMPYEDTAKGRVGFFSGTQNVADVNSLTHWNLTINSTEPIFFYCTAKDSCKVYGMVGVINPNATQTLDEQIAAAKSADFMIAPGESVPKEAATSLANPSTTATTSPSGDGGKSHGLSGGVIAAIIVGVGAFLIVCAALFFYVGRTKSLREVIKHQESDHKTPRMPESSGMDMGETQGFEGGHQHRHHASGSIASWNNGYGALSALPTYRQHDTTDPHQSGWIHPDSHDGHLSTMSGWMQQHQQAEDVKGPQVQSYPVELHSPPSGQTEWPVELEVSQAER